MSKFEKILAEDSTKKELVLKILKLLNGESYEDATAILAAAAAYIKVHTYLDFDLARADINNLIEGD